MNKALPILISTLSLQFILAVGATPSMASKAGAAAPATTAPTAQAIKKVKPLTLSMALGGGKNATVNKAIAGPGNGGSCATPNRTVARTTHSGVNVDCSIGDIKTTCTCDLSCDYVCENYVASETCTPSKCTLASGGGTPSTGGTDNAATTQPSH